MLRMIRWVAWGAVGVVGFLLLATLIIFEVLNHRDRGIVQKKPQPVQTKQS